MKLSVCVVTMNRAEQLKEALESCLACNLPADTEFVIVDNASTDETERVIHDLLHEKKFTYRKLDKNIGAGKGRNLAFDLAEGEYVYALDDDAQITFNNNISFFIDAIKIMDLHPNIATLTTQIYDTVQEKNYRSCTGEPLFDKVYECFMLAGGSHFLRKNVYSLSPYFANVYGYEELPPSLEAKNMGMLNAFAPDFLVTHHPAINKWDYSKKDNHHIIINECATPFAIKKMMYPAIFRPCLVLAFNMRCIKHLKNVPEGAQKAKKLTKQIIRDYPLKRKIKISTVISLVKEFGISVF